LLVIQRAAAVSAPGAWCFPGGGIEDRESERDAVCRELDEELSVAGAPRERLWCSLTVRQVHLAWWLVELDGRQRLRPNPQEVAAVRWMTVPEIHSHPGVLESNRDFLRALESGAFQIPALDARATRLGIAVSPQLRARPGRSP
jgi:8-oxo-dGTP pyrophosphatase MutT (NUDIX family)